MMFKRMFAALTAAALCLSLAACGASASQSTAAPAPTEAPAATAEPTPEPTPDAAEAAPLKIAGLKGPTSMGLVNLADAHEFSMYGAADEIVPQLVKGELDAAAVPANLAATLYQKTNGALQVACINTLGVLYVVELGDSVNSVADLKGKTIVTTGKGTTPEYVLRYVLRENGLDPDADVTIEYLSEATEVAARLTALAGEGASVVAMLPQPFVTSVLAQNENARMALDMNAEWEKVAGSRLVTGVLVVRREVAETRAADFAAFMEQYAQSVETANTDLEGTAALCEQYGIVAKAPLAQKALPFCNIVCETGAEMKADLLNYYDVLFAADPASVGGAMPGEDFYYDAAAQ